MRRTKFLLTGIIGLTFFLNAPEVFAQRDFNQFWKNFKSAVFRKDKASVAKLTIFPLEMPTFQKSIKNRKQFYQQYNQIFNGEADAVKCFSKAQAVKEGKLYGVYCGFKNDSNGNSGEPIRYYFKLSKNGWRFAGLDNINE